MVEDSLVDLVYGHIYGWRTLIYALISASTVLISISAILIYYSLTILAQYIALVTRGSAILLGLIGLFWLVSSIQEIVRRAGGELEAIRNVRRAKSEARNFLIAFQLVSKLASGTFLIGLGLILFFQV
jgi:hypothetical protein